MPHKPRILKCFGDNARTMNFNEMKWMINNKIKNYTKLYKIDATA